MSATCLMYGHKGWIGSMVLAELRKQGWHVYTTDTRLDQPEAVIRDLDTLHPTHVFVCVGRTRGGQYNTIDYLEDHLDVNLRDNAEGHANVIISCKMRNIHLTVLGTGCIYNSPYDEQGQPTHAFTEFEKPNFAGSAYSAVCAARNRLMCHPELVSGILNLRIRMPITKEPSPYDFLTKIVNYSRIHSVENAMSVLDTLIPHIPTLMVRQITGPLNFTNPGTMSHGRILSLYKAKVDPEHTWEEVKELGDLVKAPRSNNALNTDRLLQLCPQVPTLEQALRQVVLYRSCKLASSGGN